MVKRRAPVLHDLRSPAICLCRARKADRAASAFQSTAYMESRAGQASRRKAYTEAEAAVALWRLPNLEVLPVASIAAR